ncbi:LPS translocon maturation chaperone LptM [Pseudidiomarina terrestris]
MTFARCNAMISARLICNSQGYSLPMFKLKVMRPIIVAATLGLVACGQKGPLEMPPPAEKNQPSTSVASAPVQETKKVL